MGHNDENECENRELLKISKAELGNNNEKLMAFWQSFYLLDLSLWSCVFLYE